MGGGGPRQATRQHGRAGAQPRISLDPALKESMLRSAPPASATQDPLQSGNVAGCGACAERGRRKKKREAKAGAGAGCERLSDGERRRSSRCRANISGTARGCALREGGA